MYKPWGKKPALSLSALTLLVALSACTSSGGKKGSDFGSLDREDQGTLKVAYFDEQAFFSQYGNAFQAMFPNVDVEVVSTESIFQADNPEAELEKLIQDQHPDALFLSEDQYAALSKKGMLYDLDAAVKQDKFDIDSFQPSVIDLLKQRGGGKLYGLSPTFSSQALYYNKDLFDKYGIPYPSDGMSWEDVMKLAARFPVKKGSDDPEAMMKGDDALYGLAQSISTSNSFDLIRTIGEAKGLLYADSDTKTVSIDTPEWKSIFESVIAGYKSGSLTAPSTGGGGGMGGMIRMAGGQKAISFGPSTMRFMQGQAAMAVDSPMIMSMMGKMAGATVAVKKGGSGGKTADAGPRPLGQEINWDVVTVPVDPAQPDVTGSVELDNVVSISAASENLPLAWELVKYVNGEQLAKTSSKSSPTLSSRTAFKNDMGGKNVDAFYALKLNEQSLLQNLPDGFADSFGQMADEQIQKAVAGTQSVADTIKSIQSKGQDLLTKAMNDEAAAG
ncbi:multiple sugar transport system substrate-binding protein [Paenibacillus taihuensis]|uniref:Multiple sugar transport system substrate-binding protein n=1 Tax=Paenibacillus taihuensis TaxID=1156355 RepID=A0A3D9RHZ9_9BACL|nr:extracellular solute-binding protein [Paenibacillus taihuensis]REE78732.1 multiple sugar transport system substrate-binding protein [Paenibacillus taihuensis]